MLYTLRANSAAFKNEFCEYLKLKMKQGDTPFLLL